MGRYSGIPPNGSSRRRRLAEVPGIETRGLSDNSELEGRASEDVTLCQISSLTEHPSVARFAERDRDQPMGCRLSHVVCACSRVSLRLHVCAPVRLTAVNIINDLLPSCLFACLILGAIQRAIPSLSRTASLSFPKLLSIPVHLLRFESSPDCLVHDPFARQFSVSGVKFVEFTVRGLMSSELYMAYEALRT
jgi:hypothetical protein